ncbi:hypothetical protein [Microbacterium sp. NPDC089696]|uniref:hypothetical protein n=1 Tax=Microbacterium sp. NPDC089696 TaxID=3364199 RepID=UPI00381ADD5D
MTQAQSARSGTASALVAAAGGQPWLVIAFAGAALLVTIFSLAIAKPVGIGDDILEEAGSDASVDDVDPRRVTTH